MRSRLDSMRASNLHSLPTRLPAFKSKLTSCHSQIITCFYSSWVRFWDHPFKWHVMGICIQTKNIWAYLKGQLHTCNILLFMHLYVFPNCIIFFLQWNTRFGLIMKEQNFWRMFFFLNYAQVGRFLGNYFCFSHKNYFCKCKSHMQHYSIFYYTFMVLFFLECSLG